VQIPSGPQILDRIAGGRADLLLRQVRREPVFGDRVEQAVLVTEQPVDRRCPTSTNVGYRITDLSS
jgi:hypothetical protein